MKITICGSIAFIDEMTATATELSKHGHEVKAPPVFIRNNDGKEFTVKEFYALRKSCPDDAWVWDEKKAAMMVHFEKVAWSDVILVLNEEKNSIPGYIGANTLMEMGLALYLNKPIYLLHEVPECSYKEEVLGMQPVLLEGSLEKLYEKELA